MIRKTICNQYGLIVMGSIALIYLLMHPLYLWMSAVKWPIVTASIGNSEILIIDLFNHS
jgi:hypothetical protein